MIYYAVRGGNNKFLKKFKFKPSILRNPRKDVYNDSLWTDDINEAHLFKTQRIAQRCANIYKGIVIDQITNEF